MITVLISAVLCHAGNGLGKALVSRLAQVGAVLEYDNWHNNMSNRDGIGFALDVVQALIRYFLGGDSV